MTSNKKPINLALMIALFVSIVLTMALSVTGILIGKKISDHTEKTLSEKAMTTAQIVAHSSVVIEALEGKRKDADIQSFTSEIQRITGVRFIVVMDMHHIRKSHPDKKEIGKRFVGKDEVKAMNGKSYISIAKGTLGRSLRAFVPIRNSTGKQVGVVSVGILLNQVKTAIAQSTRIIYIGIGFGLLIGIVGALGLARKVKRILFGLEPFEIANLLQERNAMLESVREGILAINRQGDIVIANAEAIRMFQKVGYHDRPIGENVENYMPDFRLSNVLKSGIPEYDQEHKLNGMVFVVNRVPIKVDNQVIGAIATFRDKTELKKLVTQLSGVKLYAEALRVKTHEFMNKLHVILGLVQMKQYDRLTSFIQNITDHYQLEIDSVSKLVKEPILAGFFLSKLSYAREHGVKLTIFGDGTLPLSKNPKIIDDIVTIIGNLIDNAIESSENSSKKEVDVFLEYDGMIFSITVKDSGGGIPEDLHENIFKKGLSTKGENRGYGLFLVQRNVENLHGTLSFSSNEEGTLFIVKLPYQSKE
ncbi:DcuS/MalK family sensor histidine kinase [Shimazuella sp. AN120528]|uniref:DcuS/MalK family sensor histidine kinase n=1 Tax=Shimazuella soli TaxID=1892854 RepID=UPI002104E883|nr:DcuS/MalK family sensor histidine kinase [Shimazuella soli]MCH5584840.1 DcuS/MalK family sensor histidine kinase [Shimazuella soli]